MQWEFDQKAQINTQVKVDDKAMANGGINFNQSNLDMQIRRDGQGVPLPVSQQNLENIRIEGLVPVIVNIRPAAAMPDFIQLTEEIWKISM